MVGGQGAWGTEVEEEQKQAEQKEGSEAREAM